MALPTKEEALKQYSQNENLAYYVLHTRYGRFSDDEDFKQVALMSLWKACLHYDSKWSVKFSTYAYYAVSRGLRNYWMRNAKKGELLNTYLTWFENEDELERGSIYNSSPPEKYYTSVECREFINSLSNRQKDLLNELLSGKKQVEVASEWGVSRARIGQLVNEIKGKYKNWDRRKCYG